VLRNPHIVVCAYHTVGYRCLQKLLDLGANIAAVFTHDDSPTEEIWFESVRDLAARHSIPCYSTDVNNPENIDLIRRVAPDFLFSFYYRFMIKKEVLDIPARGSLNLHGSLLPKYRGRVPVNWAVINGETETGATLHYMVEKPDAGDIVDQERVGIDFADTSLDVFQKIADAAVRIMNRSWPKLLAGTASRIPMKLSEGSYFGGRKPADGLIDWSKSACDIYNLVRGVTHPYPGAFTFFEGKKIYIWRAVPTEGHAGAGVPVSEEPLLVGTGSGLLEIESLQVEGEEELSATQFIKRHQLRDKIFTREE